MKRVSNEQLAMRSGLVACSLLLIAICSWSCSIPNMQSQQCSEASDSVKEFYSWYLGTDPAQRAKEPEVLKKYISPDFSVDLTDQGVSEPYFLSAVLPTTFKVGKCEMVDPTHSNVQVQAYLRQDERTDQWEVYADTVKNGDHWQIERIEKR